MPSRQVLATTVEYGLLLPWLGELGYLLLQSYPALPIWLLTVVAALTIRRRSMSRAPVSGGRGVAVFIAVLVALVADTPRAERALKVLDHLHPSGGRRR